MSLEEGRSWVNDIDTGEASLFKQIPEYEVRLLFLKISRDSVRSTTDRTDRVYRDGILNIDIFGS